MRQRSGYTLLEVLIAMAISLMLLAALYSALNFQVRQAQSGRDLIDRATLARSILARMGSDIAASVSLCDPARFRLQQLQQQQASSGTGGTGSSGSGAGASGSSGSGMASSSSSSGSGGSNSSSASGSGSSSSTTATDTTVTLPTGVIGDNSNLYVFISKVPTDAWPTDNNLTEQVVTSDLRRVTYWISSSGKGLCRSEAKAITSQDALNIAPPTGEESQYMMAPEVRSLEITYFDGNTWQETWDSTMLGPDNITPVGSPRAIAIKIGLPARSEKSKNGGDGDLKYYRHVIAFDSANGTTYLQNNEVNQGGLTTSGTPGTPIVGNGSSSNTGSTSP